MPAWTPDARAQPGGTVIRADDDPLIAELARDGRTPAAAHPEVPFAAATTGPTNLAVNAVFRDTGQLYAYLTTKLASVPGLQSAETAPIIGTVKKESPVESAPLVRGKRQ